MKKSLYFFLAVVISIATTFPSSAQKRERVKINPNLRMDKNLVHLKSHNGNEMLIEFNLNSYDLVSILEENAYKIEANDMISILEKGAPDLPRFAQSVMIPARADMKVEIVSSEYIEVDNIKIAPSKGNIMRNIDPKTVPYEYGEVYSVDAFYPYDIASLGDPYILRDIRGQALHIQPIVYNPVQKKLRIYTNIELKVSETGKVSTKNVLSTTKSQAKDRSFEQLYKSHFLNYTPSSAKYTPVSDEVGKMLIICYDDFMDEMASFVAWKKQRGMQVEMVAVSSIGSAAQIKTYVKNYYNNNGLTFLLLVGDAPQVPTSYNGGDSDNNYGHIVGNDNYIDIFVGRFSAENASQLNTQIQRTLHYERDVTTADNWFTKGVGIASNEGSNPSDEEHMDAIGSRLQGYGYTISKCHQNGGSASQLTNLLNSGKGVLNYVGHGSNTSFASMRYTISDVNSLTNNNKLPFIFDVACVNGNFKSMTCFAEAWLRATNNGTPTGAIAICASTINQPWVPPMYAQNEMNDILIESYSNNIKRTFGGIAFNGMFKMLDASSSYGYVLNTWTVFGDPSLQVRTKTPSAISANHSSTIAGGSNQFTVSCTTDKALVAITKGNELLGAAKVNNGTATVSFSPLSGSGTIKVTVTAYNKIPYVGNVTITGGGSVDITANFSANKTNIYKGESVTFTDLSSGSPTAWNWSFNGGTPSTSSLQNPSVTYNTVGTYSVSLTASKTGDSDTKTTTNMITVSEQPQQDYCDATSNGCSSYEYISRVQFGSIDNSTTCNKYADYTSQSTNVKLGESHSLTVKIGRAYSSDKVTAWFDWNGDGDFTDSGEEKVLSYSKSGSVGTATGNITVPDNAKVGQIRMRVRLTYNSTPTPCGSATYGEVEDYGIQVVDPRAAERSLMQKVEMAIYPNPATDYFTIQKTGIEGDLTIKILDVTGKVISSQVTDGTENINVSNLVSGVYLVQIEQNGHNWTHKLVVK
jgi:PKD repeat protein